MLSPLFLCDSSFGFDNTPTSTVLCAAVNPHTHRDTGRVPVLSRSVKHLGICVLYDALINLCFKLWTPLSTRAVFCILLLAYLLNFRSKLQEFSRVA